MDEILNLIESVSEGFPSYSSIASACGARVSLAFRRQTGARSASTRFVESISGLAKTILQGTVNGKRGGRGIGKTI